MKQQESSREAVLRVMQDGVVRTDAEIEQVTGLSHNKVSGARSALWEAGLVEPLEKRNKRELMRWQLCPPERQEEARRAFRDSTERRTRGRLRQKSAGERANIVIDLLADDEVNDAVLAQLERGRAWRRARARARSVSHERDAERRARKEALRQAMDEADANVDFLQSLSHLRDLIDVLFVMRRNLEAEQDRQLKGEPARIPFSSWPALARNVREVLEVAQVLFRDLADAMGQPMQSCPLCGERLHDVVDHLGEGYIDSDAVEEDELVENVTAAKQDLAA
jgi:hypothetical protein